MDIFLFFKKFTNHLLFILYSVFFQLIHIKQKEAIDHIFDGLTVCCRQRHLHQRKAQGEMSPPQNVTSALSVRMGWICQLNAHKLRASRENRLRRISTASLCAPLSFLQDTHTHLDIKMCHRGQCRQASWQPKPDKKAQERKT